MEGPLTQFCIRSCFFLRYCRRSSPSIRLMKNNPVQHNVTTFRSCRMLSTEQTNNACTVVESLDRVQRKNMRLSIDQNSFLMFEIPVPKDLREVAIMQGVHNEFQKALGAMARFIPETGNLVVVSRAESSRKPLYLLKEAHFRNLRHKVLKSKPAVKAASLLKSIRGYSDEFLVRADLLPLSVGDANQNVQKARKIVGITNIEVDEKISMIKISGETVDAVRKARSMLEYGEEFFKVPLTLLPSFLGENGCIIREIEEKSGVLRIGDDFNTEPNRQNEDEQVKFVILGSMESIAKAKILIEYHLAHLKENEPLWKEKHANVVFMQRENILTIPNVLCVARIVFSPYLGYLIIQSDFNLALGLLAVAGVTDALDGWIARTWKSQSSKLGSFLDPMADKVLIATLFLSLTYVNLIPVALTSLIVARDVALVAAGFYVRYKSLPPPRTITRYFDATLATAQLAPTSISKFNTLVQLALVGVTLGAPVFGYVDHAALHGLWYLTAGTTVTSAMSYVFSKGTYKLLKARSSKSM